MGIQVSVVLAGMEHVVLLGEEEKGNAGNDCKVTIHWFLRCLSMKALQTSISTGLSG